MFPALLLWLGCAPPQRGPDFDESQAVSDEGACQDFISSFSSEEEIALDEKILSLFDCLNAEGAFDFFAPTVEGLVSNPRVMALVETALGAEPDPESLLKGLDFAISLLEDPDLVDHVNRATDLYVVAVDENIVSPALALVQNSSEAFLKNYEGSDAEMPSARILLQQFLDSDTFSVLQNVHLSNFLNKLDPILEAKKAEAEAEAEATGKDPLEGLKKLLETFQACKNENGTNELLELTRFFVTPSTDSADPRSPLEIVMQDLVQPFLDGENAQEVHQELLKTLYPVVARLYKEGTLGEVIDGFIYIQTHNLEGTEIAEGEDNIIAELLAPFGQQEFSAEKLESLKEMLFEPNDLLGGNNIIQEVLAIGESAYGSGSMDELATKLTEMIELIFMDSDGEWVSEDDNALVALVKPVYQFIPIAVEYGLLDLVAAFGHVAYQAYYAHDDQLEKEMGLLIDFLPYVQEWELGGRLSRVTERLGPLDEESAEALKGMLDFLPAFIQMDDGLVRSYPHTDFFVDLISQALQPMLLNDGDRQRDISLVEYSLPLMQSFLSPKKDFEKPDALLNKMTDLLLEDTEENPYSLDSVMDLVGIVGDIMDTFPSEAPLDLVETLQTFLDAEVTVDGESEPLMTALLEVGADEDLSQSLSIMLAEPDPQDGLHPYNLITSGTVTSMVEYFVGVFEKVEEILS